MNTSRHQLFSVFPWLPPPDSFTTCLLCALLKDRVSCSYWYSWGKLVTLWFISIFFIKCPFFHYEWPLGSGLHWRIPRELPVSCLGWLGFFWQIVALTGNWDSWNVFPFLPRTFTRRNFVVPFSEEVEEHLYVALVTPVWRRQLQSLLKNAVLPWPVQMSLSRFWDWVGKLLPRFKGHTWISWQYYTFCKTKTAFGNFGEGWGHAGCAGVSQLICEWTYRSGFLWVVHLTQFGGAVSFLQSCMGFLSRADVHVLLGPG